MRTLFTGGAVVALSLDACSLRGLEWELER